MNELMNILGREYNIELITSILFDGSDPQLAFQNLTREEAEEIAAKYNLTKCALFILDYSYSIRYPGISYDTVDNDPDLTYGLIKSKK
jgi:hypothetical protein